MFGLFSSITTATLFPCCKLETLLVGQFWYVHQVALVKKDELSTHEHIAVTGFTKFDYQGPLQEVCPIAAQTPTNSPSINPSLPTGFPQPTKSPTEAPSSIPGTIAPTKCIPYPNSKSKGRSSKNGSGVSILRKFA